MSIGTLGAILLATAVNAAEPWIESGMIGELKFNDANVNTYMVSDWSAQLEEIQWFSSNSHMLSFTMKFSNGEVLEHNPCDDCEMGSITNLNDIRFTNACYKKDHLGQMLGDTFWLDHDEGTMAVGTRTHNSDCGDNNVELLGLPIKGMIVSARNDYWCMDYIKFIYGEEDDLYQLLEKSSDATDDANLAESDLLQEMINQITRLSNELSETKASLAQTNDELARS